MAAKNKSNEIKHHPRLRRPRRSRVGRLDRSRASRPVVGAARLHAHHAQQGSAARRPLGTTRCTARTAPTTRTRRSITKSRRTPKLVYDHGGNDDRPPLFRVTVLFAETGGKTKMDMTMALPTPEAAEETRKFIKKAGGDATWDRLAEYLEKESSGKETVRHQPLVRRAAGSDVRDVDEPGALLALAAADRLRDGVPPRRHSARRQARSTS